MVILPRPGGCARGRATRTDFAIPRAAAMRSGRSRSRERTFISKPDTWAAPVAGEQPRDLLGDRRRWSSTRGQLARSASPCGELSDGRTGPPLGFLPRAAPRAPKYLVAMATAAPGGAEQH
eukprot:6531398-Alexandrium_andersonii.AAC.1